MEQYEQLALRVEADIHLLGWDQGSVIFAVLGKPAEPYLRRVAQGQAHPVELLEDPRLHVPHRALGVAVVTEGWSYPRSLTTALVEEAKRYFDTEDEQRRSVAAFMDQLYQTQPPSSFPDRVELRMVNVLLRTGEFVLVQRIRDEEPEALSDFDLAQGRVPDAMRAALAR